MIALLASPLGRIALLLVAGSLALGSGYLKGRSDGHAALMAKLASDRVTILLDGKAIDHEVLQADDDALCGMLGGCGVPDPAVRN